MVALETKAQVAPSYLADKFVMAVLRACAGAVLVGAGTVRAAPHHLWTPAHVYPDLANDLSALRRSRGLAGEAPRLVVLTAAADLDLAHPALPGAVIATTTEGARRLDRELPPGCEVWEMGEGRVVLAELLARLRAGGQRQVLTEGGPTVMGALLSEGLLDEVFLTVAPLIAGRGRDPRAGLVQGVELVPGGGGRQRLLSARRHKDHLFLRYGTR